MSPYELIADHIEMVRRLTDLVPNVIELADRIASSLGDGGTVFFMGNGGSAADSQHLAAEFVGRFERERRGLSAIALTTDTSVLTAVGNDYGYEFLFARQIQALCRSSDVVVGMSTSGDSPNIVHALRAARDTGAFTAAITGSRGGGVRDVAELTICVPSNSTARIQEATILLGHIICHHVEETLVSTPKPSGIYV